MIECHHDRPFDRIRRWDTSAGYWTRVNPEDVDMKICLGHAGQRCPLVMPEPKYLKVIHEHGYTQLQVYPCACPKAGEYAHQLVLAGLWPATWKNPGTAITIAAFSLFHNLKYGAQLNAHDYTAALKRMTDAVLTDEVNVSGNHVVRNVMLTLS